MLTLRRTSILLPSGHVTFWSAKYSNEFLPMGKTINGTGMKIMEICPEYLVSLVRIGFPYSSQLCPSYTAQSPAVQRSTLRILNRKAHVSPPPERPRTGHAAWVPSIQVTGSKA